MIAKIVCYALQGLEGVPVEVETDVAKGIPAYEMVGLPDAAVKESKERVRSAIKNSALLFPLGKITVNFAPADIRKEGAAFDLAVAISLLKASEQLVGGASHCGAAAHPHFGKGERLYPLRHPRGQREGGGVPGRRAHLSRAHPCRSSRLSDGQCGHRPRGGGGVRAPRACA